MDRNDALDIARKFASAVHANYHCRSVFLFGSHARGMNREESDIDIAVILEEFKNPMDIRLELMRLRRKIDSRIEPHPFRAKDFTPSNPIAHEILKSGRRIKTEAQPRWEKQQKKGKPISANPLI
ncbi:conserved hypothetical protein [Candidatus Desulfarcum epimagneticum]|uniref:Polymerase beta nucleotidyltransferase domain-containing protein n=1 Tax=uncultured Desulfobacteraceae bacterium TaxID=218296 RepID=A0A484HE38_9BACT|nr:conserved hypothetical protein [uncultured Desulfobacteraceae bacterium]